MTLICNKKNENTNEQNQLIMNGFLFCILSKFGENGLVTCFMKINISA